MIYEQYYYADNNQNNNSITGCFLIMSHVTKNCCKLKSVGVNALRIINVILIEIMSTVEMIIT